MKRKKPPRPPRCLCCDVLHWLLGIVSPSLYFGYKPKNDREARQSERYKAAAWQHSKEVSKDVY